MKKTNETNTVANVAPTKKTKTYYAILKTAEEANVFLANFDKYKEAFPKIVEQVNLKAMRGTPEEKDAFVGILRNEIQKLSGTVRSTLSYAKNHAEDRMSPLAQNQDAMEALKRVRVDIGNLDKAVEFAISQAETTSVFHALARGIIPSDYAVSPPIDEELPEEPIPNAESIPTGNG